MSAFSAGPWKLRGEGTILSAAGEVIATTGYRVSAVDDQDAPNARLISAAPELLGVCESALIALEEVQQQEIADVHDLCVAIRAAITKARSTK